MSIPKPKTKPEKKVEDYLVRRVKEAGGLSIKLEPVASRFWPDRLVVVRGVVAFVELKAPNGRLSKGQKHKISQLRNLDMIVEVLWSVEEVDAFMALLNTAAQLSVTTRMVTNVKKDKGK